MSAPIEPERPAWTFLTNHAHVLLALARDPDARLRDVAVAVGITERATQAIVADLEAAEYLVRHRVGRRNRYTINRDGFLRHPAESTVGVSGLIDLLAPPRRTPKRTRTAALGEGKHTKSTSRSA
jgi:hypothetical protein